MTSGSPIDYPIGKLLRKLPDDVQDWILVQNLESKTTSELRELLRWGRRNFKLPPWSVFTAIMQGYAAAALLKEGGHAEWEHAWFANQRFRPLDMYEHDYEDAYEIWVTRRDGSVVFIGWLINKYDGRDVFSFWNERTERYYADCSNFLKIQDPVTQEVILNHCGLSKWRDHVSPDGRVFLPAAKHRVRLKKDVKGKHRDEQLELPLKTAPKPTVQMLEIRLKVLKLFQSVMNPEAMAVFIMDNPDRKDLYMELCSVLRSSVDVYVTRLGSRDVTNIHIPDDVVLACRSVVQLYTTPQGIANSIQFWLDELLKTDPNRI